MSIKHWILYLASVCFILLFSSVSSANLASVYGIGNKAIAMGNAYTADPDDASATYYNPAGLALEKGNEFSLGITYFYPAVWIRGADGVTNYIDNDKVLGFTIGIDSNLGHMTGYDQLSRLSLGLLIYTPPDRAYSVHAIPANDPSFPVYTDAASQLMLLIGLGYEITDYLMVGVSALLYMPGTMRTLYYLDTSTAPTRAVLLEDRGLTISATPEAGLIIKHTDMLQIGAAYRMRNSSGLQGQTTFIVNNAPYLSQSNDEKIVSTPDQIAVGISITPSSGIRVNADVTYSIWSSSNMTDTQGNPIGASDTVTPALGIEYRLADDWALRAGYSYSPSPFSPQSGGTNYVDSDKNIYSLGAGYEFGLLSSGIRTRVDIFVQLQELMERNNNKPLPYASYSNGGLVWSSGLSLSFKL